MLQHLDSIFESSCSCKNLVVQLLFSFDWVGVWGDLQSKILYILHFSALKVKSAWPASNHLKFVSDLQKNVKAFLVFGSFNSMYIDDIYPLTKNNTVSLVAAEVYYSSNSWIITFFYTKVNCLTTKLTKIKVNLILFHYLFSLLVFWNIDFHVLPDNILAILYNKLYFIEIAWMFMLCWHLPCLWNCLFIVHIYTFSRYGPWWGGLISHRSTSHL